MLGGGVPRRPTPIKKETNMLTVMSVKDQI